MSEELKPCPFCSSKCHLEEDDGYILCEQCGFTYDISEYEVGDALEFWNTRPREQQLEQALLEAKTALDKIMMNEIYYAKDENRFYTQYHIAKEAFNRLSALNLGEKEKEKDGE